MARKKKYKFNQELIGEVKEALDLMLRDTPDGHLINMDTLPEPYNTVLRAMQGVGAMFGTKALVWQKDENGRYTNKMIVFTAAKYRPKTSMRRNSRRRSVRRNSRRMAARKRRRTSRM